MARFKGLFGKLAYIVGQENVGEACARASADHGSLQKGSWMAELRNDWGGTFARGMREAAFPLFLLLIERCLPFLNCQTKKVTLP